MYTGQLHHYVTYLIHQQMKGNIDMVIYREAYQLQLAAFGRMTNILYPVELLFEVWRVRYSS